MKRALALALLLTAGCLTPGDEPPAPTTPSSPTTPPPTGDPADLAAANKAFALDAFRALAEPGQNLFLSPYSISTALQMVYGGARGATRDAMREALRLGASDATLDADAAALLAALAEDDPNATLEIGNSLWIDRDFAPEANPAFAQRARDAFDADLFERDFAAPGTPGEMNAWASDRTHGKVPKVVERLDPDEVMILMNAVYFKGAWTKAFNASCTQDARFTRSDGSTVTVPMMCGGEGHAYDRDEARTLVRLPYGDGRMAMYVVLPEGGATVDHLLATWDGDVSRATNPKVILEMPRFKLATTSLDLQPALTDLGMGIAFTDRADFTGIAPNLLLTRATHDAVLEVDEQGTVAAAVTTIGVGTTSIDPNAPVRIRVDRPFLLAIHDGETDTFLFLGKVEDPTAG